MYVKSPKERGQAGTCLFSWKRLYLWKKVGEKMYKLCKTEQSALRQRQIEDALLSEMTVRRYEDITVSDLCQKLAIPRKAFYRYFNGEEGALFALLDHRLMEYGRGGEENREIRIFHIGLDLEWFFRFWLEQKVLLDALERSGISGILVERAIRNSQQAQVFETPEEDRAYVSQATAFIVCGLMSMVLQWHHTGSERSVEEMAALSRSLLGNPLVPELRGQIDGKEQRNFG